jgi:hypothetical protein
LGRGEWTLTATVGLALISFRNACRNPRIDEEYNQPTPEHALAWAAREQQASAWWASIGDTFHSQICDDAAHAFRQLATKLHDLG